MSTVLGRPAACRMTAWCHSACQTVLTLPHGAGLTRDMPKLLDFSCKSPVALAELDLLCQTEGEQRQTANTPPSLRFPGNLWCAVLHLLSHLIAHCSVPACLYPSGHHETLLCAVQCCATPLPCPELRPCCLQGLIWPGSARVATRGGWHVYWPKVSALPLCCARHEYSRPTM